MGKTIRVGTRGSALALIQADSVIRTLEKTHPQDTFSRIIIRTSGDKIKTIQELREAGKGVFTKEIEQALLSSEIDLAVHCAKDLPTEMEERLHIGAFLKRDDPADAFVGRTVPKLENLAPGSEVGTASLRRQAFLKAFYPKLKPVNLRGNLDTRLKKISEPQGKMAGIIVAHAGLDRIEYQDKNPVQRLSLDQFVPASGQGAIALQCRTGDQTQATLLAPLQDQVTAGCVQVERAVQQRLEGGCQVPMGIYAQTIEKNRLQIAVAISSLDGLELIKETASGSFEEAEELTEEILTLLEKRGAKELLRSLPRRAPGDPR